MKMPVLLRRCLAFLAQSLCLLAGAGQVGADEPSRFDVQGFGTLGAVRTTTDRESFVRDLSQRNGAINRWTGNVDSRLGIQLNAHLDDGLEGAVQVLSRYRYDNTYTPEVSWAYLAYNPDPTVRLRVGRLGTNFFTRGDSRQVGYSYLTVRPPGDFYWSLPFYHIDGADATKYIPVGDGVLSGKVFFGQVNEKIPLSDWTWDISGSLMGGGRINYKTGPWDFRVGFASIRFSRDLPLDVLVRRLVPASMVSSTLNFLGTAGTHSDYYAFGATYEGGPWFAQLALNHIIQGSTAFQHSDAGYGLLGYRIGAVAPYVGYSWVGSKSRGDAPNRAAAAMMADSHAHQKTGILGVRWDFAQKMALKAQWDAIRGEPESIFPYRRDQAGWAGKMDVFSVTFDFIF